jgi:tricorn protease
VVSYDGNKLMARQGAAYVLMDAEPAGPAGKKTVATAGLTVDCVPQQEWRQIVGEVWRRYRDFFYVKNMHGYDWPALRRQ